MDWVLKYDSEGWNKAGCAPRYSTGSYIHRWDSWKDNKLGAKWFILRWWDEGRSGMMSLKAGGIRVSPHVWLPWKYFWNLLIHLSPQTFSTALKHSFHRPTLVPSHRHTVASASPHPLDPTRLLGPPCFHFLASTDSLSIYDTFRCQWHI
jgi:hypothetical protein